MLHTFGGQLAMFGRAGNVNSRPFEARGLANSSMVGTGFTMEGIHNSYVMYDLMSEMSWRRRPVPDLPAWFAEYAARRYGSDNHWTAEAWRMLARNVFNSTVRNFHGKVLLIRPPQLGLKDLRWYNVTDVLTAWDLMVTAATDDGQLGRVATFRFDLVDLTRQALANLAPVWYDRAYRDRDVVRIHENGLVFVDLLKDLDRVLGTNSNFMLGPWLEAAKNVSSSDEEMEQFEFNARNQVTLWGPDGQILDYGGKQWSGLVRDYYLPRWEMFFKSLERAVLTNTKFDKDEFRTRFLDKLGRPFGRERRRYPTEPVMDTVAVATGIHSKWRRRMQEVATQMSD